MSETPTTYHERARTLSDHCADCRVCLSPSKGLCDLGNRLLDDLLATPLPREGDR
jgi:hypothetical protein